MGGRRIRRWGWRRRRCGFEKEEVELELLALSGGLVVLVGEENYVFPLAKIKTMTSVNAITCWQHQDRWESKGGGHRRVSQRRRAVMMIPSKRTSTCEQDEPNARVHTHAPTRPGPFWSIVPNKFSLFFSLLFLRIYQHTDTHHSGNPAETFTHPAETITHDKEG